MARSDSPAVVAPGAPVDLRGVSSYDRIAHGGDDLELPREMCQRVHCLVGVNADFHDLSSKEPLGGVVSSGRLLRSPAPPHPQVSLTRDGRLLAGLLDWAATLTPSDGTSLAVTGSTALGTRTSSSSTPRRGDPRRRPPWTPSWCYGPASRWAP